MYTGTLIEDLMATVERAEEAQAGDNSLCEFLITDGLIALAQANREHDSKLFWQQTGVA